MLQDVKDSLKLKNDYNLHIFDMQDSFKIKDLTILPFEAEHNDMVSGDLVPVPTAGFLIQGGNEKLLYLTDTFFCRYKFKGLTHLMLEVNYDENILNENVESGIVSLALANRIRYSHFELKDAIGFLKENDLGKCREIHMIHLSSRNSDGKRFKTEVEKATGVPTFYLKDRKRK